MSAVEKRLQQVTIREARIIFRNFAGVEGQYNRAGDRNFGVVLPPDVAQVMEADGWNVKYLRAREEGEQPTPWVSVSVSYKGRPPVVTLITHRGNPPVPVRVKLPEDLVEMVDYVDIGQADLILNPYLWNVNGKSGVKAYLKTLFITVAQDELEQQYSAIEEVSIDGTPLAIGHEEQLAITDESNIIDAEVIEDDDEQEDFS